MKYLPDGGRAGQGRHRLPYMEEDVILAICKITGKLQKGMVPKEDAAAHLEDMKAIVRRRWSPLKPTRTR